MRNSYAIAIFMIAGCGVSWATDVVIEVKRPLTPLQLRALKRDHHVESVTDVSKFGFIRLHIPDQPSGDAESVVQGFRRHSWIRQADLSPPQDNQLMVRSLDFAELSEKQKRDSQRVQGLALRSVPLLARNFGFLRLVLAKSTEQRSNVIRRPLIALAPGLPIVAAGTYFEESSSHLTWSGVTLRQGLATTGDPGFVVGSAVLSIFHDEGSEQARIWGQFVDADEVALIRPLGNGKHLVIRLDRKQIRPVPEGTVSVTSAVRRPRSAAKRETGTSNNAAETTCQPRPCNRRAVPATSVCPRNVRSPTIKLGVLLREGTSAENDIRLEEYSQHIAGQLNAAFACSRARARIEVSAAEELRFSEPSSKEEYDNAFVDCEAFFSTGRGRCILSTIYRWRYATKSDVVLLLSRSEAQENFAAGYTKNLAFAVVPAFWAETVPSDVSQVYDDLIALHEIGHVLGGAHDSQWYVDNHQAPRDVVVAHGHGYVREASDASTPELCTIMSQRGSCFRQLYWSTPNVWVNAASIGSCKKEDVARLISERAPCISEYKQPLQTVRRRGTVVK